MITLYIGFGLLILSLVFLGLQRLYSFVPARELKRLGREGDDRAQKLYHFAAFGAQGRLVLWVLAGLSAAFGVVLVSEHLPLIIAVVVALIFAAAAWLTITTMQLTNKVIWLPVFLSKPLGKLTNTLHKPLSSITHFVNHWRWSDLHTNVYDAHDLDKFLERQAVQPDNRIHTEDLEILRRTLKMRDTTAKQVLVSKRDIYMVDADDLVGPVLLDQLHKHGQHTYLVYKDEKDNIIGTLRVSDAAAATEGGRVLDFVRPEIHSIKETDSLHNIVDLLRTTGHQLVVVVNDFEDFIGQVTLEGLIDYLFDRPQKAEVLVPEAEEQTESTDDVSPNETEVIE